MGKAFADTGQAKLKSRPRWAMGLVGLRSDGPMNETMAAGQPSRPGVTSSKPRKRCRVAVGQARVSGVMDDGRFRAPQA